MLGVSRPIYVNVDSPNQGFPYFNFLGEAQCKKTPCMCFTYIYVYIQGDFFTGTPLKSQSMENLG